MVVFEGMVGVLVWAVRRVGYWVRPYDMLADRRRWWWQPRQRCGYATGGSMPPARSDDRVVFLSPGEEIVTRERAVEMGLAAAWDALVRAEVARWEEKRRGR